MKQPLGCGLALLAAVIAPLALAALQAVVKPGSQERMCTQLFWMCLGAVIVKFVSWK